MKTAKEIAEEKFAAIAADSTLSEIVIEAMEEYAQQFREKQKHPALPKRWEDLRYLRGAYTGSESQIYHTMDFQAKAVDESRNIFAKREQAEASIALAQLSQLREVYRRGWKPDWNAIEQEKFIIIYTHRGNFECSVAVNIPNFLSFQSPEIRDEFLENFRDLIKKAKPLMS